MFCMKNTSTIFFRHTYFFLIPVADTFRTDVDVDMAIDCAHCCIDLLKRENIGVKYDLILATLFAKSILN